MTHEDREKKRDALVMAIVFRKWSRVWSLLRLDASICESCGAPLWWARTKTGKRMPVDEKGESHFANCSGADKHRRRGAS